MSDRISVLDHGHPVTVTFSSINTYHGGAYPDGIAHALKAMQAAFPVLSERPLERREVHVLTAYSGAGGRDALEMVTRAITGGRIMTDRAIGGGDVLSDPPGPYVFRFTYRGKTVEASLKPGHVTEEFVALEQARDKSLDDIARHEELKAELANRFLRLSAADVYAVRLIEG